MLMETSGNNKINFRLLFIPIQFVGFYLLAYLLRPGKSLQKGLTIGEIALEIITGLLFCWLLSEITIRIIRFLDRHMPWQNKPLKRSFIQFIGLIVGTVIFSYCFTMLTNFIFEKSIVSKIYAGSLTGSLTVTVVVSLMTTAVYTVHYLLTQWEDAREESQAYITKAEELKRIAMEFELQSLRMQLDPHFLFNSFSTLSALIGYDDDTAQLFLQKLSDVYRYMTINVRKNMVSVAEEIEFTKTYFYLMKIRFEESVILEVDVSGEVLKKSIPPITLQLLVENALKHNIASPAKPLIIKISDNGDDYLKVTNTLQRLSFNVPSTSTGMKNVEDRYRLLTDQLPRVTECSELYTVCVPLIKLEE